MSERIVAVLGATPKPDRFAFKAMKLLKRYNHKVVLINPAFDQIDGEKCFKSILEVENPIDTLTMYVGEARSEPLIADILKAKPRRIILNPGAENDHLRNEATKIGIEVVEDCTLIMLNSGQF